MTTITANTTVGINLNPAFYSSPVVIDAWITVSNPNYPYGVYRHPGATTVFAIENNGTITAYAIGVYLAPGGSVTNAAAALITAGGASAIKVVGGAGTVVNDGSIAGPKNNGISVGVMLESGGTVTNAAAASIFGEHNGVDIAGDAGTVTNAGTISSGDVDVRLDAGGSVVNTGRIAGGLIGVYLASGGSVTNAASATITTHVGIEIKGHTGTVVNHGDIAGGYGIEMYGGGTVTNTGMISSGGGGVRIFGGGVVNNEGTIQGSSSYGIYLRSGGTVTNPLNALIRGVVASVKVVDAAGTVVNAGSIVAGVSLQSGGSVTNAASGSIISSGTYGIAIGATAGIVVNAGEVQGYRFGIRLSSGGSVSNAASGYIAATIETKPVGYGYGIKISGGIGTVINDGTISGDSLYGVDLAGGSVTNATFGVIRTGIVIGGYSGTVINDGRVDGVIVAEAVTNGVSASAAGAHAGTLTNAGTISGSVAIFGTGSLLILDPGFAISGLVSGDVSASSTLELASAASVGTVAGLGTQFIHFGSIVFDAGAEWSITGLQRGLAGEISGFAAGDTIEMTGVTASDPDYAGGILTLNAATGSTLDLPGDFSIGSFNVTSNADGTEVTLACFCGGTRLLTVSGEVAVEALTVGDLVVTRSGRMRAVKWIGWRRVEPARHARPQDVWPVRIRENAFGVGVPHRFLQLSPDHAVYWQGVLIPVRYLCNGETIRQEAVSDIVYYHVELDAHDVVLAEGLAAESYLDTGNRRAFANGGAAVQAHPDFSAWAWEAVACAPLVVSGPVVEAARRRAMGGHSRDGGIRMGRAVLES